MEICIHDLWNEYELIDCGNGRKLERFGEITLIRPEITATGKPHLSETQWKNERNRAVVSLYFSTYWSKNNEYAVCAHSVHML